MHVRSLSSTEELQRYVNFGQEVYRDISQWVPPDSHHLIELLSGAGGFGSDTHIQPFLIEDGDKVLATITAVTNDTYDQRWNERLGHLLFFEALPDQNEAVETLMRAADEWFHAQRLPGGAHVASARDAVASHDRRVRRRSDCFSHLQSSVLSQLY